jgi:hypothetical protein
MLARPVAYNFREVVGGSTTGKPVPRLASGAQLWRLNQLGILGQALNAEGRVSADRARELLREAAVRGLWAPRPRRYRSAGKNRFAIHELRPDEPALAELVDTVVRAPLTGAVRRRPGHARPSTFGTFVSGLR